MRRLFYGGLACHSEQAFILLKVQPTVHVHVPFCSTRCKEEIEKLWQEFYLFWCFCIFLFDCKQFLSDYIKTVIQKQWWKYVKKVLQNEAIEVLLKVIVTWKSLGCTYHIISSADSRPVAFVRPREWLPLPIHSQGRTQTSSTSKSNIEQSLVNWYDDLKCVQVFFIPLFFLVLLYCWCCWFYLHVNYECIETL